MQNNMDRTEEVWKDIPNYEGHYQASDLGRVRSLDRTVEFSDGRKRFYKGRIKKGTVSNKGYKQYSLSINGVSRTFQGSQLVAMTFLGHEPNGHNLVVDHINGDKSDNRVKNLRIVTNRANTTTCFRSDKGSFSSGYAGVSWDKPLSKWQAQIYHDGVRTYLGLYNTEVEASNAYQAVLSKIEDGSFNPDDYKREWTSEYRGVAFYKANNKWNAYITINGKRKHLGYFNTEVEASNAYQLALSKIKDGSFNPYNYKAKWTSGYKGVFYNKKEKKWRANIQAGGNQIHIGTFPTEELAYQARLIAEQEVRDGVFLANRKAKKNKVTPTP